MKGFGVTFSRHADEDFDAVTHFIARPNPLRALSFVDDIQECTRALLSVTPHAGRREGDYRLIVLGRHGVVYTVNETASPVRVLTEGHRDGRHILETWR